MPRTTITTSQSNAPTPVRTEVQLDKDAIKCMLTNNLKRKQASRETKCRYVKKYMKKYLDGIKPVNQMEQKLEIMKRINEEIIEEINTKNIYLNGVCTDAFCLANKTITDMVNGEKVFQKYTKKWLKKFYTRIKDKDRKEDILKKVRKEIIAEINQENASLSHHLFKAFRRANKVATEQVTIENAVKILLKDALRTNESNE